ncbi:hypothetical protein [Thermomonas sp. LB-4]|uniref:hypothetical protein n=1 Tax=Thermomonas sp. LB-4 TaxID=3102790 RepID=UPI002ED7C942
MALSGVSSNIAASGMQAAAQRMQAAASNTANRQTEGFDRLGVVQSASPEGGVQARMATTGMRNDGDGAVVSDAVEAREAAQAFAANTAAFRAREDALGTLLDAFA